MQQSLRSSEEAAKLLQEANEALSLNNNRLTQRVDSLENDLLQVSTVVFIPH